MNNVKPCNERNAIKVVAFALEFTEAVDESVIKIAREIYSNDEELREELPREQLHEAVTLQLDKFEKNPRSYIEGITFDRLMPSGISEWAISLRNNTLVISCGDYTRWNEVWGKAENYLKKFMPVLLRRKVLLIGLEYIDEFNVSNHQEIKWKDDLFNKESKYIPPNLYSVAGLWHSHHGFILSEDDSIKRETVHTINIDYIREMNSVHKLIIRTQHRSKLEEIEEYSENLNGINSIIRNNHNKNKEIMSDLLSKDMCSEINLEGI